MLNFRGEGQSSPPDALKIYELSLIWREAEYNFAFWDKLNLDWDAAYKAALPAVLAAANLRDYYLELTKFVALLRDGHSGVALPQSVEDGFGYLPILTMNVGGERVIFNTDKSVRDVVPRWGVIRKVDGVPLKEYVEREIYPYIWHEKEDSAEYYIDRLLRRGDVGDSVALEIEIGGETRTVTLERADGEINRAYGSIAPKCAEELREIYTSDSHKIEMTDDGIAVITIDTMANDGLPRDFLANFPLLQNAKGYVIDIRQNGGGDSTNSDAVAAAFIGGGFANQRSLHPIHIGAYKAWGRYQDFGGKTWEQVKSERGDDEWLEKCYKILNHCYYEESLSTSDEHNYPHILTAPLVVLTSADTGSAAEDFLVMLEHAKRAIFVGSASCGSTGQPLYTELESGGAFQICTRHCTHIDGREFTDAGVLPHIPCEMTLDDYKNGRDAVLDRGLAACREANKRCF